MTPGRQYSNDYIRCSLCGCQRRPSGMRPLPDGTHVCPPQDEEFCRSVWAARGAKQPPSRVQTPENSVAPPPRSPGAILNGLRDMADVCGGCGHQRGIHSIPEGGEICLWVDGDVECGCLRFVEAEGSGDPCWCGVAQTDFDRHSKACAAKRYRLGISAGGDR